MNEGTLVEEGHEIGGGMVAEQGMIALLNKSEIDQQIATAHRYPRSLKTFKDEALQMVTLTERIAEQCLYSLPRDGKTIEGPSARFAEIMASAWRNNRAGARVVSDEGEFITAQGVFHDLERNVAITYEVQRRIVDRHGKRFKVDMIGVTGNAASSIALRNAVLKGIPKPFWEPMYQAARRVVMGDFQTLANRRASAFTEFQRYGIKQDQIYQLLAVQGMEDIGLEQLVTLKGVLTAIQEGDTTPEQAFETTVKSPERKQQQPINAEPPAHSVSEQEPAAGAPLTGSEPEGSAPNTGPRISGAVLTMINGHLSQLYGEGFPTAFCEKFGVSMPDELRVAQVNDAVKWITQQRKAKGIS